MIIYRSLPAAGSQYGCRSDDALMWKDLLATKSLKSLMAETAGPTHLSRVLSAFALTNLGIGAIIGAGIFVITGLVAHDKTGPALVLSFAVAGVTCVFAALCYAEFASMVPVAGSAYTYAYATLGELFAWIIGWDLLLEYTVASASVANAWSHYLVAFLESFGIRLPAILTTAPIASNGEHFELTGTLLNLPALLAVAALTVLLVRGIRESARFNTAMVAVKIAVVLFVIVVGSFYVHPANWRPFAPYGYTGLSFFGKYVWGMSDAGGTPVGMLAGAAMLFFAFIGFDAVSTQAEEAKQPQRDMPIGIIVSLVVATVLYIAVSAVLTGMVPYTNININAPVADAFRQVGLRWAETIISVGALTGITSVLLVLMLSQPRILLAMSRDGLLPKRFFAVVHQRFRTPWKSTIVTGVAVALMASLIPLNILAELVNIGTLLAFVIVCVAVPVMRKSHPQVNRPFRVPLSPVTPAIGAGLCLLLMFSLPSANWVRLFVWLAIGLVIYFTYSRHHSALAEERKRIT